MMLCDLSPAHVLAARQELARRSLADFALMIDIPTVPMSQDAEEDQFSVMRLVALARHHALLLAKLQGIHDGSIANLMVLMPPGSAKSIYCDVVFAPWFLAQRPRRNVILASYGSDIARKQGRRARQLITSKSFRNLTGLELKGDVKAADEWALTNGSEFMSGGITSGLTGNRCALGVLDDPIKGRAEAESETIRNSTWDAYIDDFCSRLIPGAPQVMILTRWHEDDPAGRILPEGWDGQSGRFKGRDRRDWEVLCLPAIADRSDDPLGRALGETLWPEWFSHEHWAPFQANARTWSSLYQQKPTPEQGSYFRREWFRRYRAGSQPEAMNRYVTTDHAPGGESDSDFTCCRVWGIDPDGAVYLLDGFRSQETLDVSIDRVLALVKRHKPLAWFPEDDNNWKSIAGFVTRRMLEKSTFCRIEPISPHGSDKKTKAQPFQGMAAAGRWWLPEGPEGDDVLDQYLRFPGGKNDDEIDAGALLGMAIDMAHPAIQPVAKPDREKDSWERAFDKTDTEEATWKTA